MIPSIRFRMDMGRDKVDTTGAGPALDGPPADFSAKTTCAREL